jgi:hypothetical protein
MATNLILLVDIDDVAKAVTHLSEIEGKVTLPVDPPTADGGQSGGAHFLHFIDVAPLAISLAGTSTALFSFATAVLNYRAQKSKEREAAQEVVQKVRRQQSDLIMIRNEQISIDDIQTAEELVAWIERNGPSR